MALDQRGERTQRRGAGAHLVGESRQADQRLGARRARVSVGFHPRRARLALTPRHPLGEDQPVSSGEVAGERFGRVGHARERI